MLMIRESQFVRVLNRIREDYRKMYHSSITHYVVKAIMESITYNIEISNTQQLVYE